MMKIPKMKTIQITLDEHTYNKLIKIKKKISTNWYDFSWKIIKKGEKW